MNAMRNRAWLFASVGAVSGALLALAADTDLDSMDDAFEDFFGLNKTNAADAVAHNDDDQLNNAQEAARWTDPFEGDTDLDGWKDHADSNALSRAVMMWGHPKFTSGDDYLYTGPAWWLGAFKVGGAWTNQSWEVAAYDTNPASLNILFDRSILTNAVRMDVTLMDRAGAGLETDLLDTNGVDVATNLHGNLISGGGGEVMRKVSVDLPANPNGSSIRLRRTAGEVTVYETFLYVDADGDGLDSDQEAQLGTADTNADSDGDGYSDRYESQAGTNPLSALSSPTGPITLQVPSDAIRACAQDTSPTGTGYAVAYAQCAGAVSVTWADTTVGTCPRHIERVWTASDLCSNVVSATQVVVAADSLTPDDIVLTRQGAAVTIPVLLNDGGLSDLVAWSQGSHGAVAVSGGSLVYTPASNHLGRDTFVYVAGGTSQPIAKSVNVITHQALDEEAARDQILAGVTNLASATQPGYQVVYGPESYAMAWYPEGAGAGAMIAAGSFGAGRFVSVPDHQMGDMGSYGGSYDSGRFYLNSVAWLAGTGDQGIRIVTYNSGTATWLAGQGYTNVQVASEGSLAMYLQDADVFIGAWLGSGESESNLRALADFAIAGGGLFIADYGTGYSWWWGKEIDQAPGNLLLREAGVGFSGGNRWETGSINATNRASGQVDAEAALAIIADDAGHSQAEKDQASYTLNGIYDALEPGDLLLARFDEVFLARVQSINPTPATPVSDSFRRGLLRREATLLQQLPANELTKHRTADALYGAISNDAPRVTRTVHIDTARTRWQPTGLYAAPGELVTVVVPAEAVGHGFSVLVNQNNQDSLDGLGSYYRMPRVTRSFSVNAQTVQVANAFGGLIHFNLGGGAASGQSGVEPFDIEISGAVEAPYFMLGQTSEQDWLNGIRDNPGRQAELACSNLIITLPASYVRGLQNPAALMAYWNDVVGKQDELGSWPTQRLSAERINLDVQISAGWAHSGYPIQGPWGHGGMMTDLALERTTMDWGMYHELGHNHQAGWWTFAEDGELTVNIFANYCVESLMPHPDYSSPGWRYCASQLETLNAASNAVAGGGTYASKGNRWPFWFQLADGFGWDGYRQVFAAYRGATNGLPVNEQEEKDQWLVRFSESVGYNLAPFMCDVWGLEASSSAVAQVSGLPAWMPIASGYADGKTIVPPGTSKEFDLGGQTLGLDGVASILAVNAPSHGSISNAGTGLWTYAPAAGYQGADSFTYDVQSSAGNTVTVHVAIDVSPKGVLREVWTGIAGTALSALKTNALYPDSPTSSSIVPDLAQSPDRADSYGVRMRAWLVPPATGEYTFWLASDDEGELRLSTDADPTNATLIANVPGYAGAYQLTKYPQQQSSAIPLVAGQRYYIEALMKEGGGGDNLSVAWEGPGFVKEYFIPQQHLLAYGVANQAPEAADDSASTFVGVPVNVNVLANDSDPDGDAIAIESFTQGANASVASGGAGVFTYSPAGSFYGQDAFTYTIEDGRGGTDTATVTVTVVDTNPPSITCPSSVMIECGGSAAPEFTGTPTVTDEDPAPSVTHTDSVAGASCPNVQVITRTWIATDASGNSASCQQVITVADTTAPALSAPSNVVVECGEDTGTNATGWATASDACGGVNVSHSDSATAGCGGTLVIQRLWAATDACGNTALHTQTVTVVDTTAPALSIPSNLTVSCGGETGTNVAGSASASDGCGGVVVAFSDSVSNTCGAAGLILRTWTATDACGNVASGTQTITVEDATAPLITPPTDGVAECGGSLSTSVYGTASATDGCSVVSVEFADTTVPYDPSPAGMSGMSLWLRADAGVLTNGSGVLTEWQDQSGNGRHLNGNASKPSLVQNVINGLPGVRFNGSVSISRTNWLPADWPTSNCAIFVVSKSTAIQSTYMIETVDSSGNPPNGNRMLMHWPWGDGVAYWDYGNISANGRLSYSYSGGTNDFHVWQVSSYAGVGQSIYSDGVLKASDANASVLNPTSLKLQIGRSYKGDLLEVLIFNRALSTTETARVGHYLSAKYSLTTTYRAPGAGTVVRSWTAEDACGNSAGATQRIALVDTQAPAVTAPSNAVITCGESSDPANTGTGTALDGCEGALVPAYTDLVRNVKSSLKAIYPLNEPTGATAIADISAAGLTGTIFQALTGQPGTLGNGLSLDGVNDYVNLGTNVSINGAGDFTVSAWFKTTDTNGGFILSQRDPDGDGYSGGYYLGVNSAGKPMFQIWSWTYSDSRVATGTNAVNDGQWHHILGIRESNKGIKVYLDGQVVGTNTAFGYGMYGYISTYIGANKRDNNNFLSGTVDDIAVWGRALSPAEVVAVRQQGVQGRPAASLRQVIERTWKAKDASGYEGSALQSITVADTTPPEFGAINHVVLGCGASTDPTNTGTATATDACSTGMIACTYTDSVSAGCGGSYVITRSWKALDECGNASFATQLVTVADQIAPQITAPASTNVQCGSDTGTGTLGVATASDACSAVSVSYSDNTVPGCGNTYVITRTWTATDACSNSATAFQTITILDTTAPSIVPPTNVTIECGADTNPANTGWATGSDTCGSVTTNYSDSVVAGCGSSFVITRVWTITDACGNPATATQTITVADTVAPVITTMPEDETVTCGDDTGTNILGYATTAGGCGPESVSHADEWVPYTSTPAGMPGLSLWLKCDVGVVMGSGSTIAEWQDQSGNGRVLNAGSSKPSLVNGLVNGRPGIRFSGANTIATTDTLPSDWPSSNVTVFVVSRSTAIQNSYLLETLNGSGQLLDSNRMLMHWPWGDGAAYWDFGNINSGGRLSHSYAGGTSQFHVWQLGSAAGVGQSVYQDGVLKTNDTTASVFNPSGMKLQLGRSWKGEIAELVVFNRALTSNEAADVGLYLSLRHGLPTAYRAPRAGAILRRWTATDGCNETVRTQVISRTDGVAPSYTGPADITVSCADSLLPATTGAGTYFDACDTNVSLTYQDDVADLTLSRKAVFPLDERPFATAIASHDGTATGAISGAQSGFDGKAGSALWLDGADDYVNLGTTASINGAGDFTVAAWVKSTDANGGFVLSQRDPDGDGYAGGYFLGLNGSGKPFFQIYSWYYSDNRVATGTTSIADGQWHHLMGIRRGKKGITVYVDGQVVGTNTAFGYGMHGDTSTYVGANKRDNNNFLAGTVDDVGIWDRALADREIATLYYRGADGKAAASLVSIVDRTLTAFDHSGNYSAAATQRITVADQIAPWFTTFPSDVTIGSHLSALPADTGYALAADNCAGSPMVTWSDSDDAISSGLILKFALDQAAGAATVVSQDGLRTGTVTEAVTGLAGVNGRAMLFDGVNDKVSLGSITNLNGLRSNLTVSAWVWIDALSGIRRIVSSGHTTGWGFGINGGNLRFTTYGVKDYDLGSAGLYAGGWIHVAAVMDNGCDVTFYVNGVAKGTVAGTAAAKQCTSGWNLGTCVSGGGEYWKGRMDEVGVWSRALSAAEILHIYAVGRQGGAVLNAPANPDVLTVKREWTARDEVSLSTNGLQTIAITNALADTDGDGLADGLEALLGTSRTLSDTDGDGLADSAELNTHHTSPVLVDTDGDGMADGWEVQKGFNPLVFDASSDADGDGLTNLEEFLAGTNPNAADTDGDGVADRYEVTTAYSNPNIVDFTTNVVVAIVTNGASATVVLGDWELYGDTIFSKSYGGELLYRITPPAAGEYVLEVEGTQFEENGGASFELSLDADGRSVGVTRLVAPHGVNGKAWFFLPHLDGSEHVFNLAWRYQLGGGSLRVVALRLLELGGPDTNSNGVADWIDHRHQNMLGATAIPAQSWYSPVCVEGQAGGVSALSVASSYAASNVPPPVVRAGVVNNWHADVHLDPVQDTEVTVHANMGSLSFTSVVTWVPLNVLQADTNAFMVRRGSTVRLTAYPEGDSNGVVGITVVGVTNVETTAGQPVDVTFAYDGVYTVTGAYVGVVSTSRVVVLRVMGGSFINDPIVWPNSSRTWDNPAMPPDARLEWDSRIYPAQTQPYGTGIRSTVGIKAVANYQVVARLFEDGPVLDEATVQGWVTYGSDQIAMNVITTYEDGTQLYEITIQNMGLPPDGQMVIWIMAGGIVYADGTTSVTLTADDFDDTGACRLRMLVSPDSWTSFCHKMRVYQNGQWVWGN